MGIIIIDEAGRFNRADYLMVMGHFDTNQCMPIGMPIGDRWKESGRFLWKDETLIFIYAGSCTSFAIIYIHFPRSGRRGGQPSVLHELSTDDGEAFLSSRPGTALLSFLSRTVSGLSFNDLFIVQSEGSNGGCDAYFNQAAGSGILDGWHTEIIYALATAGASNLA